MSEDASSIELKPIPDGFSVDVDHWKMDRHFEWEQALTDGNRDKIAELLALAIFALPADYGLLEPHNPDTYLKELIPKQWLTAIKAVSSACYNCFLI